MKRLLITVALIPGCSCATDEVLPDAQGPVADAAVDAMSPVPRAFVVAGDFGAGTGIASTIDLPGLEVSTNVIAGVVSSDPVVRTFGDRLIVVNRFGADNISIIDAATMTLIEQVSTGAGSNPQDVARAQGKLYVPTLQGVGVAVISEANLAGGVASSIDLSAADPDGNPNCSTAAVAAGRVFVACQLLDDATFAPRGPGLVAVIDPVADVVVGMLTLENANPFSFMLATPAASAFLGDIYIGSVPDFDDYATGCIERITTNGTPAVAACRVTNATLGGYVSDLAVVGDELVATVTTCQAGDCFANPTTSLLARIDDNGVVTGTIATPSSHPTDIEACPSGQLIVSDTDYADSPGVRVYGPDFTELTSAPLDIGLPPAFTNAIACY